MAQRPVDYGKRSISWELRLDPIDFDESIILRRDVMKEQLDQAGNICVDALANHFDLSRDSVTGMYDALRDTHSWVTFGQEGRGAESGVYPVGIFQADVVDISTRQVRVLKPEPPEVRVSLESVAEEASNLLLTAQQLVLGSKQEGLTSRSKEVIDGIVEDHQLLVDAACRIASARRILRYVLLPNGSLPSKFSMIGFETWYQEQIVRRGGKKPSAKVLKEIKANYADNDMSLKNVRRTSWAPIFFQTLGIDFGDYAFYLEYRQQVSRNSGYTVTFSSPLTILLEHEEVSGVLEGVFNPSLDKSELKLV